MVSSKICANELPQRFIAPLLLSENLLRSVGAERCPVLRSESDIAKAFKRVATHRHEVVVACAIDSQCRLLHWSVLAIGNNEQATVRVADAFLGVIECGGSGIILIHNHPSGSLTPSKQDFDFTSRVAEAGIVFGYPLIDHVIITKTGHRSVMTSSALKHPRNRTPLIFGCVSESSQAMQEISWRCHGCSKVNLDAGKIGIQSFDSKICRSVRCRHCRVMSWLSIN